MAQNDQQKVIAFMRKNPGASQQKISDGVGIPMAKLGPLMWAAEPEIDNSLRIANSGNDQAIAKRVVNARENENLRWERIAAYLSHGGKTYSVADVKRLYSSTGKDPNKSYTGRGRNFTGVARAKPATSGRRGGGAGRGKAKENKATSGRRGAAAKSSKPSGNGRRRGSRAQRGAAKDPS